MRSNSMDHSVFNWTGNVAAAGAIGATLLGWIPSIAAVVALIWYVIQIYESETFKGWRDQRRKQKIAKLTAKLLILTSTPAEKREPGASS